MIQFIVTAVIVVIALFVLVVILALMVWVISKLLRWLFPQRYSEAIKSMQANHKLKVTNGMDERCPDCANFGKCPAAMQMPAPCRMYAAIPAEEPAE